MKKGLGMGSSKSTHSHRGSERDRQHNKNAKGLGSSSQYLLAEASAGVRDGGRTAMELVGRRPYSRGGGGEGP